MSRKFFISTPRLLAGKFGKICTEFPLATFSHTFLTRHYIKFSAKNHSNSISCEKSVKPNANSTFVSWKINSGKSDLLKWFGLKFFFAGDNVYYLNTKSIMASHRNIYRRNWIDRFFQLFYIFKSNYFEPMTCCDVFFFVITLEKKISRATDVRV